MSTAESREKTHEEIAIEPLLCLVYGTEVFCLYDVFCVMMWKP